MLFELVKHTSINLYIIKVNMYLQIKKGKKKIMLKYICYSSKVFKDFIGITKVQVRQHVIEITSIGYLCKKDAIKISNLQM